VLNVFREMVLEQYEFRELVLRLTLRDLMLRYKQTVMGFAWAVFMPLLNTAIFSVIFMRVAPIETPVPYPLFAYSGLVAWNFFASALRFAVTSLTSNPNLVTKVYFPREVFPFSAVIVALVDLLIASTVLAALMAYYGVPLRWTVLWLPLVLTAHVLFTAAVALLLAMGNLFYRDVKYLFEIVLSVWMFATSVVYPVDGLTGWAGILRFNPMTPIIEAYRSVLLYGEPASAAFFVTGAVSLAAFLCSWWWFHRSEFAFAENL
jgi:lipopolysaccharide transport system permease protein